MLTPLILTIAMLVVAATVAGPAQAAMPRFEYHRIAEVGWEMGQTSLVDIDRDGDLDWVVGERTRTWWFENRGKAASWSCRLITADHTRQDFHSLAVADFDNDGDLDVFSGGGPLSQDTHRCLIWENADGKAGQWKEHLVLEGKQCHEAKAADVDRDGDIDICTKPWDGDLHVYLRNRLIEDRP